MRASFDDLLQVLICPATGQPLALGADGYLSTPDGAQRYPIIDGAPVLFDEERSLFDIADVVGDRRPSPPGAYPSPAEPTVSERVLTAVKRIVPSNSRNIGAHSRFRRLAELLRARAREKESRPRVLFIGAQIEGAGTSEVLQAADIETVETDVDTGPRTQVVCDAHDLPFAHGSFDAVVAQAVLEYVADPPRVAEEVHRVLGPDGLVLSEISFMQQVHGGAYDFTRYSLLGHRRLWRWFDQVDAGAQCGPAMALAWSLQYFAQSFARRPLTVSIFKRAMQVATSWLPPLDLLLAKRPGGVDAAAGTYFLGTRRDAPLPDREVVRSYRGLARWGLKPEAETSPGIVLPGAEVRSPST